MMNDSSNDTDFNVYQRRMPHWRLKGGTYFITWRVLRGQRHLSPDERTLVANAIKYFQGDRYFVNAYVVMNDHVHVVVRPLRSIELSKILHTWKSFTAHAIQKRRGLSGSLWQEDNHTRVIRIEDELFKQMSYILNNPRKRWPDLTGYAWVEWFTE